jgi:hypothetical protein
MELPTFYDGMCYIIEPKQAFQYMMTVAIEKKEDKEIDSVNVRVTSDYEYLKPVYLPTIETFEFKVPFGGTYKTQTTIMETMIKPLKCKSSDSYVSDMQCFANLFFSKDLSPCPVKCLPIQMKGFQYANKSATIEDCANLEDEICNGGPLIVKRMELAYQECLKPCKETTYKDSVAKLVEPMHLKDDKNTALFDIFLSNVQKVEKEVLVYDTNDMIGAIGGLLGLFLGFSFFDVMCKCLDNLIMPLVNYFISSGIIEG